MTRRPGPLRVLSLVASASDQGGAERFAIGLARCLPRDRFEPWLCSTRRASPEAAHELAAAGVRHVRLDGRGKLDVRRLAGLSWLLRRERFDIVHSHMFGSNFWGATLGRAAGVPVVIAHEHNWSYSGERVRVAIDRRVIAPLATRFVAVSESNRRGMIELERIPAHKIVVMPTAYIPHSVVSQSDIRSELGLSPHSLLVGIAATLRVEKAHEVLIEAHAQVVRQISDAHLVIAGDGPRRLELTQLVAALGMESHVHFLGARHDVSSILASIDLGALSSDWEGMPLFVLECMSTGTPIVATNVGGLPEMIEDGVTGMLVPPRDPRTLAKAITELLHDPRRRRQLASAATESVRDLGIESVTARFVDLYEDLIAERAHTGKRPRAA